MDVRSQNPKAYSNNLDLPLFLSYFIAVYFKSLISLNVPNSNSMQLQKIDKTQLIWVEGTQGKNYPCEVKGTSDTCNGRWWGGEYSFCGLSIPLPG